MNFRTNLQYENRQHHAGRHYRFWLDCRTKAARTLRETENYEAYAIGSRSMERAKEFADTLGDSKAYGSYSELIADPGVDPVYVGTPPLPPFWCHPRPPGRRKPCLVERRLWSTPPWKASEIVRLSRERGVFVAEAIWTRYQRWLALCVN